jgi:hypothetical protein
MVTERNPEKKLFFLGFAKRPTEALARTKEKKLFE